MNGMIKQDLKIVVKDFQLNAITHLSLPWRTRQDVTILSISGLTTFLLVLPKTFFYTVYTQQKYKAMFYLQGKIYKFNIFILISTNLANISDMFVFSNFISIFKKVK